jgi:hypothetical protein
MGFFDSKSTQQSVVETNTVNTSSNFNVQDSEGVVVGHAEGPLTIITTDFNATGDASRLAQSSVSVAESIARHSLDLSLQQTQGVLDYQRYSANIAAEQSHEALAFVSENSRGAIETVTDTVKGLFGGVLDFLGGVQKAEQTTLGNTVAAINSVATENAKSTDQRLAETTGQSQKYMLIGVGILAVAVVAITVFKKGN